MRRGAMGGAPSGAGKDAGDIHLAPAGLNPFYPRHLPVVKGDSVWGHVGELVATQCGGDGHAAGGDGRGPVGRR
jgi:hypothetical protein